MATLPVRDLGKLGIISDANPYDLPINAYSDGCNVIFDEGKVQRAPVFKKLFSAFKSELAYSADSDTFAGAIGTYENTLASAGISRFVASYNTTQEVVLVCDTDGSVREYPNGQMSIVTPTSGTPVTNTEPWAHAQAAGLSVLSRKAMRPYIRNLKTDPRYVAMANDWGATDTCSVIRGYLDFLIALNVNKAGVDYPTMVKWTNPLQYSPSVSSTTGVVWDASSTTTVAGENILGDMRTPIIDGLPLHNTFIIYSSDQVWAMEYTGSSFVFNFKRIFPTGGIVNVNCVTEVEGKHFVFGVDDLYMHDGVQKQSVADERVRRKIYQSIDRNNLNKCFVQHDSILNLIYFAYIATDSDIGFQGTSFCNRAAVYNYRNNTWSFMDLPNVAGAAETNLDLSTSYYESFIATYNDFNNIYSGFENTTPRVCVMLGISDQANNLTDSRVYAVDLPSIGLVPLPVEPETIKQSFVERIGIDLDKEAQLPLRSYKVIKAIMPQVDIAGTSSFMTFQLGGSDNPNQPVNWQTPVVFDHRNDYKVDTRASGRYLAMRVTFPDTEFFRWSAYDIEIAKTGGR